MNCISHLLLLLICMFSAGNSLPGQVRFNPDDPDFFRISGTPFAPVYDNVNDALKDKSPLKIRILQGDVSKLWAKMERFDRLEILYLANNGMEHLPAGIARCQSLFAMAIRKNPLKTFPEELGFLPALLYLELSDTRISEIPESFSALDKLELFRIVNTQTELLKFADNMPGLRHLRVVQIFDTPLGEFPKFLLHCPEIEEITLVNCGLTEVPDSIAHLKKLKRLYLHENQIREIPSSWRNLRGLTHLDISENKIEELPEFLAYLPSLSMLNVKKNQIDRQVLEVFRILIGKKAVFKSDMDE